MEVAWGGHPRTCIDPQGKIILPLRRLGGKQGWCMGSNALDSLRRLSLEVSRAEKLKGDSSPWSKRSCKLERKSHCSSLKQAAILIMETC